MSRLRLSSVLFGVLLVAASASSASRPPEVYRVGDVTGQAAPLGNDDGGTPTTTTTTTLSEWAMRQRFYVGDVLDFERSSDTVLLVRQGDYERCSAASPARRFADGGDDTRFTLARPGVLYLISGAPARCEAGQRMVVRVVDPACNNISGAPTPAPGTQPTDDILSRRRRRRPLTIAEMQMVAGALGFAAGFFGMFLVVGFFICRCP